MSWAKRNGTDPKYQSAEHKARRKHLVDLLRAGQSLPCTAKVCEFGTPITNPDGRAPDGLHLGHADNGIDYDGPQHRACNIKDGARRANRRSRGLGDIDASRWVL